jgi:hypothetical protein
MILNTISAAPKLVESLTSAFGEFPLRLTDKDISTLSSGHFILRGTSLADCGYVGHYQINEKPVSSTGRRNTF